MSKKYKYIDNSSGSKGEEDLSAPFMDGGESGDMDDERVEILPKHDNSSP